MDPNHSPTPKDDLPPSRGSLTLIRWSAIIAAAASLLSGPFLARGLGPAGRGELQVLNLLYHALPTVLGFGLGAAVASDNYGAKIPKRLILKWLAVAWVVGIALIAAVKSLTESWVNLGVLIAFFPTYWLTPVCLGLAQRNGRRDALALARVIDMAGTSLAIAILFFLDFLTVLSAITASLMMTALSTIVMILRGSDKRSDSSRRTSSVLKSKHANTIRHVWPAELLTLSVALADQAYVAASLSTGALGLYAVAASIGRLAGIIPSAATQTATALGAQASLMSQTRRAEVMKSAASEIRVPFLFNLICCAVFTAVGSHLLRIFFGAEFVGSHAPAVILILNFAVIAQIATIDALIAGVQPSSITWLAKIIGFVVFICLIVSIRPTELSEVALTSSAMSVTTLSVLLFKARSILSIEIRDLFFPLRGDGGRLIGLVIPNRILRTVSRRGRS